MFNFLTDTLKSYLFVAGILALAYLFLASK